MTPCCKTPRIATQSIVTVLRDPLLEVRLHADQCLECKRLHPTPAQIAENQRRILVAAPKVHVSPSMLRELFR